MTNEQVRILYEVQDLIFWQSSLADLEAFGRNDMPKLIAEYRQTPEEFSAEMLDKVRSVYAWQRDALLAGRVFPVNKLEIAALLINRARNRGDLLLALSDTLQNLDCAVLKELPQVVQDAFAVREAQLKALQVPCQIDEDEEYF